MHDATRPAVIQFTAPGRIGIIVPRLSRWIISPLNRYVTVARLMCGCGRTFLDKTHTARHRRCSSTPRRASRCRLGAAAKAWPEACPLCGGCRTKEHNIRRTGGSHRTDGTAVDPGSSNAGKENAVECAI